MRRPGRSRDCSITALPTLPSGAAPAWRITRIARVNCSSSQNTTTVTPSTMPARP